MIFHRIKGIPQHLKTQMGEIYLYYSKHALQEARHDRYGAINYPLVLDTDEANVVEVEAHGNTVVKVLYEVEYDDKHNLYLAVVPYRKFVKTIWLCKKDDTHETLDLSVYDEPSMAA